MQSNPTILVNLLVILVKTPVSLLVKLTKLRLGGAMGGGLPPLQEPLPDCMSPRGTNGQGQQDQLGVHGETTMRLIGDPEGNKRLPLYDFRCFPDFLGRTRF